MKFVIPASKPRAKRLNEILMSRKNVKHKSEIYPSRQKLKLELKKKDTLE